MAKKGLESTTTRVEGCSGLGPPLNALVLREEHRCDGLRCDVHRSNHALPDVKATFLVHTLPLARDHPSSTRVKFATPAHVEKDRLEVLLVLCSAKLKLPVVHGSLKNVGHRQPRLALEITSAMAGIELSSCLQLRVGDVDLVAPEVFEHLVLADVTCRNTCYRGSNSRHFTILCFTMFLCGLRHFRHFTGHQKWIILEKYIKFQKGFFSP